MSAVKTCKACGEEKPEAEFDITGKHRRNKCRDCRQARQRELRAQAKVDPSTHDYQNEKLPPGYSIKGVSHATRDEDGNIKWIKTVADKERLSELLMEAMEAMAKGYTGLVTATPAPDHCVEDLLTVVPLGDPHIGLHCWHEEVGNDFDLKIAAQNMRTAVAELFASAPPAQHCMIINLGDYFHADTAANTTTKGTPVDVDGRRVKVVRVGLDIFINVINTALTKHEFVHVKCVTGNHDGDSSKMLAIMLDKMFSDEPRVTIDTEPTKFHRYRFGKVLIGTTHGDTGKDADLGMIMATDWRDDWAAAEYFHWYKGHVHHDSLKEYTGGVIVETFRTLAPADAWHTGQGYRSGRNLKLDVWHKEWGHIQRNTIGIRRIEHLNKP